MSSDWNNRPGWDVIGGKRIYFRSKLERRWAALLETWRQGGAIFDWEYEPHRFEFEGIKRGTNSYLPDFKVTLCHGVYEWHECKGHIVQKDVTKFRRMAKYHPNQRMVLVMQNVTKKNSFKVKQATERGARLIEAEKELRKLGL